MDDNINNNGINPDETSAGVDKTGDKKSSSIIAFIVTLLLTLPYAIYFFNFLYRYISRELPAPVYHVLIAAIPFAFLLAIALFIIKKGNTYIIVLSIIIAIISPLFLSSNSSKMQQTVVANQGPALHHPGDYKDMITSFPDETWFFPDEITDDMEDVSFYSSKSVWFGTYIDVLLYYKTSSENIDNIINKLTPFSKYYLLSLSDDKFDDGINVPSIEELGLSYHYIPDNFSCIMLSSYHYTATETRRHEYEYSGVAFSKDTGEIIYFYDYGQD